MAALYAVMSGSPVNTTEPIFSVKESFMVYFENFLSFGLIKGVFLFDVIFPI